MLSTLARGARHAARGGRILPRNVMVVDMYAPGRVWRGPLRSANGAAKAGEKTAKRKAMAARPLPSSESLGDETHTKEIIR